MARAKPFTLGTSASANRRSCQPAAAAGTGRWHRSNLFLAKQRRNLRSSGFAITASAAKNPVRALAMEVLAERPVGA